MSRPISKSDPNVIAASTGARDHTYRVAGGRVGVLLLHGLCGTPSEMRFIANGLARNGYTVLCPQLAGHCGSIEDMKAATWQDWYDSAKRALAELRKDCDTVVVGGLSTGAVLSLMLAAEHPDEVQSLALFAPTLWVNGWNVPWYARLFRLVGTKRLANMIKFPDHAPHGIKDDRIRKFFADALFGGDTEGAGLPHTPGGAVLEHRWLVNAVKGMIAGIKQPTLILHPREDDLADISNAWYLQRTMKGMVEVVALEDTYHNVTIDRQRHVVVDRTAAFVARTVQQIAEAKAKLSNTLRFAAASAGDGAKVRQAEPVAA